MGRLGTIRTQSRNSAADSCAVEEAGPLALLCLHKWGEVLPWLQGSSLSPQSMPQWNVLAADTSLLGK